MDNEALINRIKEKQESVAEKNKKQAIRDNAIMYNICPDCGGKLETKKSFWSFFSARPIYQCTECKVDHYEPILEGEY
jgi:predicted SprT family Zn-dependent metalloprotease